MIKANILFNYIINERISLILFLFLLNISQKHIYYNFHNAVTLIYHFSIFYFKYIHLKMKKTTHLNLFNSSFYTNNILFLYNNKFIFKLFKR